MSTNELHFLQDLHAFKRESPANFSQIRDFCSGTWRDGFAGRPHHDGVHLWQPKKGNAGSKWGR